MEEEIKPKIINILESLNKNYSKLQKYQVEKLECLLAAKELSVSKNKNFKLQSITDLKIGKKFKGLTTQGNSLKAFKKTDVIIDFSTPKSSIEILNLVKKLNHSHKL